MTAVRLHSGKVLVATWPALIALSAVAGLAGGQPAGLVFTVSTLLCLPILLGLIFQDVGHPGAALRVLGWTVVATMAAAASGGAASPLIALFALGPLDSLVRGNKRLALEAGGFALVAYLAVWIATSTWPALFPAPASTVYLGALALAALLQCGLLTALAVAAAPRPGRQAGATVSPARVAEPADLPAPEQLDPALPDTLDLARVIVSPHGRIRRVEGNRVWLGDLGIGQISDLAFARLGIDPRSDLIRQGGHGQVTLRDGTVLDLHVRHDPARSQFIFSEPKTQAERTELDRDAAIRDAVAARTAFFASLGHDLKTPLNAIIGFADMMRAGVRGPVPEGYRDYVEIIHESGNDLLLLVEDILDLAKADADRLTLDLEPVDLVSSANSVMRQLEAQAERAAVRLEWAGNGEAWAAADARAVRQIWQNLISNAIKYSPEGGVVTVSAEQAGERLVMAVEDQGIGMDEADLARLAEPFVQGANSAGRMGTGLGLAVVKQYADLLGGQVRIETAPDRGTRVEVSLTPAEAGALDDAYDKAAQ